MRFAKRRMAAGMYLMVPLSAALGVAGFLVAGAIAHPSVATGCTKPGGGHTISLCRTKLGLVLVSSTGHTLYLFRKDSHGTSTCYKSCATFWSPLLKQGKTTLGPGVKRSLLGTTRRRNGSRQLTYSRHPLYTYKLDTRGGQTKGEGVTAFGAKWYAVSATGKAVVKMATPTTGTTTTALTSTAGKRGSWRSSVED